MCDLTFDHLFLLACFSLAFPTSIAAKFSLTALISDVLYLIIRLISPSILRAYALGYLSATGPRLISFLGLLRKKDVSYEEKFKHVSMPRNPNLTPLPCLMPVHRPIGKVPLLPGRICALTSSGGKGLPRDKDG
jgi:hypothetical protein